MKDNNNTTYDPTVAMAYEHGFEAGVTAGVWNAFAIMEVTKPFLRREEALRLLRAFKFDPNTLDKWVEAKKVSEIKGDRPNSPRTYSFNQLFKAMSKLKPIKLYL